MDRRVIMENAFDMAGVSQSRYHVAPWDVSKGMYPADEYLKTEIIRCSE